MIPRPRAQTEDGFTFRLYPAQSDQKPKSLAVILHGHGSNMDVWHHRAKDLANALPETDVILLQGPIALPQKGKDRAQLFSWLPYEAPVAKQVKTWLKHTFSQLPVAKDINSFIQKQLEKRNLKPENFVLIGNSMGGIVALQAGLHSREPYAAVLTYSSAALPFTKAETNPPLCLLMGEKDDIFNKPAPEERPGLSGLFSKLADRFSLRHPQTLRRLEKLGLKFGTRTYPGVGHELSDENEAWNYGTAFIASKLQRKP